MEANPLLGDVVDSEATVSLSNGVATWGPGIEIDLDDATWSYCLVLPVYQEKDEADWKTAMPDVFETAKSLFTFRAWEELSMQSRFREQMSKEEFHDTVRALIVEVLTGPSCGFRVATRMSIDEDEVFLLVELAEPETQQQLGHMLAVRLPLLPDVYPAEAPCPKAEMSGGHFIGSNHCPEYVQFDARLRGKLQDFRDVDVIRMCKKRMLQYLHPYELQYNGVVNQMFEVHRYNELMKLYDHKWSDPRALCQYPGAQHSDMVREYFGEELAFFFHWFNFYTRFLLIPAPLGIVLMFRHFFFSEQNQHYSEIAFAGIICCWASTFQGLYTQRSKMKILQWGMKNWDQVATVRRDFQEELRGGCSEIAVRTFHHLIAVLVMVETLVVVFLISRWHAIAVKTEDPEEIIYPGVRAGTVASISKYLITLNIKVVDTVWTPLAAWLTTRENWKTDVQVKLETVKKLFIVKFVVYYWPFFYTAFVKPQLEGERSPEATMEELHANLLVFFLSHIAVAIIMLGVSIATQYFAVLQEIRSVANASGAREVTDAPGKHYSYLQVQAKSPENPGDTDDMMELVLSMGFVMMFSVVMPSMAPLALVSNMLELRLLAYRASFVHKRPYPRGQEGLGSWKSIIDIICTVAVMCNVGLAVFKLPVFQEYRLSTKMILFVCAEHLMLMLQAAVGAIIPEKSATQQVIEEKNNFAVEHIMGTATVNCSEMKKTTPVPLSLRMLTEKR